MKNTPHEQLKPVSYAGIQFRGLVVANNDPKKLERVRIRIPEIHDGVEDNKLPWAIPFSQPEGHFSVPRLNSKIYVEFQQGNPAFPVYFGRAVDKNSLYSVADTNYPHRQGWIDEKGSYFYTDGTDGDLKLHVHNGTEITVDNAGKITITGAASLVADITGDADIKTSGYTKIEATGKVTLLGSLIELGTTLKKLVTETFLTAFDSHTHTGNMGSPTSPPIVAQSSIPDNLTSITKAE